MTRRILISIFIFGWLSICHANELTFEEKTQFSTGYEAFKSADYEKALKYWLPLAEKGNMHVQMSVTAVYEASSKLAIRKKALPWFEKAAAQGHPEAQSRLGAIYVRGEYVKRDVSKAVTWFKLAAEKNDIHAQFSLGYILSQSNEIEKDYTAAAFWYEKAAVSGHAISQNDLGVLYQNGWGVKKSIPNAIKWYTQAAAQGDTHAMLSLGYIHGEGDGVEENESESFRWYKMAADKGEARAQYQIGIRYLEGRGVPKKNVSKAIHWLTKSKAGGHDEAQNALTYIAQQQRKTGSTLIFPRLE